MTNILHSKANPNWTTPTTIVEIARALLGGTIDLDPFSSTIANQTVRATRFYDEATDGFEQEWNANSVFVNAPGLQVVRAWRKLIEEVKVGRTLNAIWIGFSIGQLCLLASEQVHPLDFSTVILRKRISFVREDGTSGSPAHGNYVCLLGGDHEAFATAFEGMGKIIRGELATDTISG